MNFREFTRYYNDLIEYGRSIGNAKMAIEAKKKEAKSQADSFGETLSAEERTSRILKYSVSQIPLKRGQATVKLNELIGLALEKEKKIPVVLGPKDWLYTFFFDEDDGEYTQETVPWDAKKALYEISVLKQPVEDVLDRGRTQLMLTMKTESCTFVIHCSNAAPDFKNQLNHPKIFPKEMFKVGWLHKSHGKGLNYETLVRDDDKDEDGVFYCRNPLWDPSKPSKAGFRIVLSVALGLEEIENVADGLPGTIDDYKFILMTTDKK